MIDFDLLTIDDLGKVDRGRSRHRPRNDASLYGGKYPFIQTGDVKEAAFYLNKYSQTYNETGLEQSKLWDPGTLCITIAANIADTAILKIPACFPDSILGFLAYKNKSDMRFVKYCFDVYKTTIEAISKGTTQDNLSLEKLRSIKFKVPKLLIQRKIAATLSAYDDLIENNNRRIAILEKMAEELYREWFVRLRFPGHEKVRVVKGVPEGWEVNHLIDYLDFVRGFEPGSESYLSNKTEDTVPFLRVGDLNSRHNPIFIKKDLFKHLLVKKNDILMSFDGTVGIVGIGLEGLYSSGIRQVIYKNSYLPFSYVYLLLKSSTIQSVVYEHAIGSTILHASSSVKCLKFINPGQELLNRFHIICNPLISQILSLFDVNENIEKSRERLLSRLMSGKIDVEKMDIQFPPSMKEEAAIA